MNTEKKIQIKALPVDKIGRHLHCDLDIAAICADGESSARREWAWHNFNGRIARIKGATLCSKLDRCRAGNRQAIYRFKREVFREVDALHIDEEQTTIIIVNAFDDRITVRGNGYHGTISARRTHDQGLHLSPG